MRTRFSSALACTFAALLSGCGGGGSVGGPLPVPTSSSAPVQSANVQFVVKIPAITSVSGTLRARSAARPMDFSPSTQSVAIAIGANVLKTADVSASSSLCTAALGGGRSCTIGVTAPTGSDQFTVTAFDGTNGTGNTIAKGTVAATVSSQAVTVNVAVTGTIAKLSLVLANPYPPVGTAATVNVTVMGIDVDGNVVMGPYPSPVSLQDSDASGATSLSTTTAANSSTAITLNYAGVQPFGSATITASLSGFASATAIFAPSPAFLNTYVVPSTGRFPVGPWNIAKGPDGNMWVAATGTSEFIKVTPDGTQTAYALSQPSDQLLGIVVGADGNLWSAESGNSAIAKITTSGVITEYPLPASVPGLANPVTFPGSVTLGKDGNIWFADQAYNVVGNITPSGTITEYALPANAGVAGITSGPDGNLWMTDLGNNAILKVSTSGQVLASYALASSQSYPSGITAGPDGNIWFTEYGISKIGRITPSGTIAEFAIPSGTSIPISIVAGPDGRMWFAEMGPESGYGKIGYITVDGKQIRDFTGDGFHVHDLAFDAHGTLWYIADQLPFGVNEIGTFAY